ncbi:hypothetical protein LWI29_018731 [Acer saccharum]|uniref:Retrovirus-related Pol polyprotein from transposon TNT 1-94 n=1 Tax=Acer saccharum TaxID=4024 RepID=A0AA39RQR7_ACESA|nr:hypothetical protein LWI29_018731 [Acer saccharum]
MGSKKDTYKIEKFNGTNFSFWKMQIEDYLYQKNLYLPIVEKLKDMSDEEWVVKRKPKDMTDAQWMVLDRKALGAILLGLSKSVAFNIKGQKTAVDLMKALSNLYEQPSAARKVHLIKKLVNLKMSENQSFKEHMNVFNEATDGLNSVSILFDDKVLEIRMHEEGSGASSLALNMEGKKGRNKNQNRNQWGRSKSRGRSKSKNRQGNNSGNQQRSKKDIECWNCGKMGHYSSECRSAKKDDGKSSANCISEELDDYLIYSLESKTESWVLDSGASFHATSHRDLFENYISKNLGKVYLGDNQACDITGKGDVKIHLNGSVWKLDNVRHVSDLRKNLVSIGQLESNGYMITFTASVLSTGDKQYFVIFINNHSKKLWVYFLRHKSDVFEAFKKWKAMVENETSLKIKKLRSDNGGEYEDKEFKKFCYQSGIKLIRTVPGTP